MTEPDAIPALDRQFGIPGLAAVSAGHGGLPRVLISSPHAAGEMYLHGGHVTSWTPTGARDTLYCSPNAVWHDGLAIRGGVPICFPWFGNNAAIPAAPAHGFVRTKAWSLQSVEHYGNDVVVSMFSDSTDDTRKWWRFDFHLVCRATFGEQLKLELIVTNTDSAPFSFEEALHAYFALGDVQAAAVRGLDGTRYIDKVDHFTEKTQSGDIRISSETDRIYLNTQHDLDLIDPVLSRPITICKQNSATTVVWNPWADKSAAMSDLGPGQWKKFLCVETANIGASSVHLGPGESHTMAARVICE